MNIGLVKATIVPEGAFPIECQFNPTQFTVGKSTEWRVSQGVAEGDAPQPQYVSSAPRSFTIDLLFDEWGPLVGDVSRHVDKLMDLMNPKPQASGPPNPPPVDFMWGLKTIFHGYVKSVDATYTMFGRAGQPLRATVKVTFGEIPQSRSSLPGQNPTSGVLAGRRTHITGAGDSLELVAWKEFGDPKLWRGLAAFNGIDDPLRVGPGRALLIPTRAEAAALS
jgi:hypothetical protein